MKTNNIRKNIENAFDITLYEIGVAAYLRDEHGYMDGEDWWYGKQGQADNAIKLIDNTWSIEKTNEIVKKLDSSKNTVLITVPSTSGMNTIPQALANKISSDINAEWYDGSMFYTIMHDTEMKGVAPQNRVFTSRKYVLNCKDNLCTLKNKNVIIIEDVVLTGSSIFSFIRALKRDGIQTTSIAALFGDPHLTAQFEQVTILNGLIRDTSIILDHEQVCSLFAKGEVNKLIETIKEFQDEDKKYAFARRIQGLLNDRIAEFMGQDPCSRDERFRESESMGDELLPVRIQAMPDVMALRRQGSAYGVQYSCKDADCGAEGEACEESIDQQEDSDPLSPSF